jgi:hypothetical protein
MGRVITGGLCLPEADGTGEIVALTTIPTMRRCGLAGAVLAEIHEAARQRGLHGLTASWTGARDDPGEVGRLLLRAGWAPAAEAGISMTLGAEPGAAFLRDLADRLPPCPYAFVPWSEIDAVQRENLRGALKRHPLSTYSIIHGLRDCPGRGHDAAIVQS